MTKPLIRQLAHTCLLSTDLQASADFYVGVLGLKRKFDFIRQGKTVGFYLEVGDRTFIEVFENEQASNHDTQAIAHFCLEVHNLDDTITHLRNAGVTVTDKKTGGDRSLQAWTSDPDGVKIEFHQYTDQSRQFTGGDCVFPPSDLPRNLAAI